MSLRDIVIREHIPTMGLLNNDGSEFSQECTLCSLTRVRLCIFGVYFHGCGSGRQLLGLFQQTAQEVTCNCCALLFTWFSGVIIRYTRRISAQEKLPVQAESDVTFNTLHIPTNHFPSYFTVTVLSIIVTLQKSQSLASLTQYVALRLS